VDVGNAQNFSDFWTYLAGLGIDTIFATQYQINRVGVEVAAARALAVASVSAPANA